MPRYLGCALTHFVFGSLFFLLGIIDLRAVNNGDRTDWSDSVRYFVIFYGVWVGSYFFLCCKRKQNKVTHFSTYKVEKSFLPFPPVCAPREWPGERGRGGGGRGRVGYSPIKVMEVLVVPFRGLVPF